MRLGLRRRLLRFVSARSCSQLLSPPAQGDTCWAGTAELTWRMQNVCAEVWDKPRHCTAMGWLLIYPKKSFFPSTWLPLKSLNWTVLCRHKFLKRFLTHAFPMCAFGEVTALSAPDRASTMYNENGEKSLSVLRYMSRETSHRTKIKAYPTYLANSVTNWKTSMIFMLWNYAFEIWKLTCSNCNMFQWSFSRRQIKCIQTLNFQQYLNCAWVNWVLI